MVPKVIFVYIDYGINLIILLDYPFAHSAFQSLIPNLTSLHVTLAVSQVHITLTIRQAYIILALKKSR